jgi:starch synthase
MRLLLASSEVFPYSKTGGLADMVGALAKSLARLGHTVGVVTPLYRGIRAKFPALRRLDWWMDLPLGDRRVQAEVWTLEPQPGLTLYFIHQPEFFDRPGIYGEGNESYWDNGARYIFLSKAVAHLARHLPWQPELVHVHDWQTALVPLLLQEEARITPGWAVPRTCLTIHNLAYQGVFPRESYALANLPPEHFHERGAEFCGAFNLLKSGIEFADTLTTVSPRYAREITTAEFGEGLDGVLRRRSHVLTGILNGVDYDEWKTEGNPHLPHPFNASSLVGKRAVKLALQRELGLAEDPAAPLFANISRMADQKGMDILLGALEEMLPAGIQFVQLGTGQKSLERAFQEIGLRHPGRAAVKIGYDHGLSHRIEAGADFFVMPSRFEPCGLNQMYSLRYGTIPIVRATGGLDDSVVDPREDEAHADGLKFHEYSPRALARALRKALAIHANPRAADFLRRNGMNADFSWARTSEAYLGCFRHGDVPAS